MVGLSEDKDFRRAVDEWATSPMKKRYDINADEYEKFEDNKELQQLRKAGFPPIRTIKAMKSIDHVTGFQLNSVDQFIDFVEDQKTFRISSFAEVSRSSSINKDYYFTFEEFSNDLLINILYEHLVEKGKRTGFLIHFFTDRNRLQAFRADSSEVTKLLQLYIENKLHFKQFKEKEVRSFASLPSNQIRLRIPNEDQIIKDCIENSKHYTFFGSDICRITPTSLIDYAVEHMENSSSNVDELIRLWKEQDRFLSLDSKYILHNFNSWDEFKQEIKKREVIDTL